MMSAARLRILYFVRVLRRFLSDSLSLLLSLENFAWSFLVCYFEHKSHRVCRGRGGRGEAEK